MNVEDWTGPGREPRRLGRAWTGWKSQSTVGLALEIPGTGFGPTRHEAVAYPTAEAIRNLLPGVTQRRETAGATLGGCWLKAMLQSFRGRGIQSFLPLTKSPDVAIQYLNPYSFGRIRKWPAGTFERRLYDMPAYCAGISSQIWTTPDGTSYNRSILAQDSNSLQPGLHSNHAAWGLGKNVTAGNQRRLVGKWQEYKQVGKAVNTKDYWHRVARNKENAGSSRRRSRQAATMLHFLHSSRRNKWRITENGVNEDEKKDGLLNPLSVATVHTLVHVYYGLYGSSGVRFCPECWNPCLQIHSFGFLPVSSVSSGSRRNSFGVQRASIVALSGHVVKYHQVLPRSSLVGSLRLLPVRSLSPIMVPHFTDRDLAQTADNVGCCFCHSSWNMVRILR